MKKILSLLIVAAMLTGCAGTSMKTSFDNQFSKVKQATGLGGVFNFLSKKTTDLLGSEFDVAQAEVNRLKAENIDAVAKPVPVKVKDENGIERDVQMLGRYIVNSTSDEAAKSVAKVANKSTFPGTLLIVANPSQKAAIESALKATVESKTKHGKPVVIAFHDRKEVESAGIKPCVAWVPTHPVSVDGAVKKGGAA